MTSEMKRLMREARKRVKEFEDHGGMPIPARPDGKGFSITIKCNDCGAVNKVRVAKDYQAELYGASETMPDQTWLNIICTKCGNSQELWTDWAPKKLNLKKEDQNANT